MKNIYVVMMVLPTFINHIAYCITGFKYNHFSLSFDKNLDKLYSFQIKNKDTTLVGGFMEEQQVFYFHGKKNKKLEQVIYEIPVTDDEYSNIYKLVNEIKEDKEYTFNYMSAWLMFIFGGVKSYKSYHCVEFICNVLTLIKKIKLPKKTYKMHPKDLYKVIDKYKIEIRTINSNDYEEVEDIFLKRIKKKIVIKKSFYSIKESFYRAVFHRTSPRFDYKKINFYNQDCIVN